MIMVINRFRDTLVKHSGFELGSVMDYIRATLKLNVVKAKGKYENIIVQVVTQVQVKVTSGEFFLG